MTHTVVDLLPRDAIPSIDDPTFGSSFEGQVNEEVIVVTAGDSARAYPTRILQNHEVVNDDVGGEPIAVTWCPLCASAVVYDRQFDGATVTFGVSGKLADNDLVLYERETGSEWKQSSGVCLSGEYAGDTLTVRPAATMTWAAFTDSYPDGEVLKPPAWGTTDYGTDRFTDYMTSDHVGPGGDPRLRTAIEDWPFAFPPKALTLGLTVGAESRGYPRPTVEDECGVVTDRLAGTSVASLGRQRDCSPTNTRISSSGRRPRTADSVRTGPRGTLRPDLVRMADNSCGCRADGCSRSRGGTTTGPTRSTAAGLRPPRRGRPRRPVLLSSRAVPPVRPYSRRTG